MVGTCKSDELGKEKYCRLCNETFIAGDAFAGGTFVYCPKCSIAANSRHVSLTEDQKRRRRLYRSLIAYPKYIIYRQKHLDYFLAHTKEWRLRNPDKKYVQKRRATNRYNEETLATAENRYQRWGSDEIEYISENRERMTAREIAISLGRTYNAVIMKACREKISLMTEDKKHMRRVTR